MNTGQKVTTAPGQPGTYSTLLLYALVISIVLLPIRFDFFAYVIAALILLICVSVLKSNARKPAVPYTPIYLAIAIFTLIFAFWGLLSISYKNHLNYVFEDSAGFLVYLIFPVLYIYIASNNLSSSLSRSIVAAAIIVAVINLGVFAAYYSIFGSVEFENLVAVNAILSTLGFTWDIGASGGILRADTKAGHYMLLGMALLLFKFICTRRSFSLMLLGVLFVGALLDGHRALLAAIAIFFVLVAPVVIRAFELYPVRFLGPVYVLAGLMVLTFTFLIDTQGWWERLGSFESSSVNIRMQQIPSLVEEISKHPLLGNGFGSHADMVRSAERPFMYEMDFFAVGMKLGVFGAVLYFSTYISTIAIVLFRRRSVYGYIMFSVGLAYFFYMGTNGGFAMSPISSFFHVLLFLCVAFGLAKDERVNNRVSDKWNGPGTSRVSQELESGGEESA